MEQLVYLCLNCGRVSPLKIETCPHCNSKNITAFELSGIYGGGG